MHIHSVVCVAATDVHVLCWTDSCGVCLCIVSCAWDVYLCVFHSFAFLKY